ncbi:MAG TPA: OmpA family protein [Acetobacteraceae bacterium]|nr:OmpA family protein [Acetobacteraceae bacterium]
MNLRKMLAVAGLLALPTAAFAQPVDGLYVGGGAGWNILNPQAVKSPAGNDGLQTPGGPMALISAGYGFGNGLRVELEGSYRHSNENETASTATNGTWGLFANALYDIDLGSKYVFPYVGIGVGGVMQDFSNGMTSGGRAFSGNQADIAGQVIAGLAMPVPAVPGLSATVEYRMMATANSQTYHGVKVASQVNNAALLGLRYAFNAAPPPPPPAPVPTPAPAAAPVAAPSRTYLVFFDFDKADLNERARQIIAEAAQNVGKVQVTRIEVNGYTDTAGTPAYNQKLSQRRADSVAAELVRDGVPQNEIVEQGYGEAHPLVQTGANVREPQNRRVEIILK